MSVLTNGKVKFDCITEERNLQLEVIDVEAKLLPKFHLNQLRKLIDDKLVNNEALQVVIEMRDKLEDQIKAEKCSNKVKLQKEKRKTQQRLFDCFKKVSPQESTTAELDSESESSLSESE